eukprot:1002669-Rhodomonas_salina.1
MPLLLEEGVDERGAARGRQAPALDTRHTTEERRREEEKKRRREEEKKRRAKSEERRETNKPRQLVSPSLNQPPRKRTLQ